ncbi:YqhR family membrane protein [Cohnella hashimotonis]|uniref:YqhR family membrane protein n=1 Tax=Cohnella hashimotonis TaxID=2826895 RepID=A0ABT6THM5_9BACL|nr:YqhR family membrane protein [Cohnella hashimotonis]MDI4645342.1 YqhR family membrane protein [Cohnella hashimotonis]
MEQSQNKSKGTGRTKHPAVYCLTLGLFAGLIWGLLRWLTVAMNLTKVPQAFLADPFIKRERLDTVAWHCVGLALFVVMSILAAYLYWLILGKLKGPWPGLLFGAAWWGLLFLWIGPMTGAVPAFKEIGLGSIFTECSIYLLWGLFIGYSFAFEFHKESAREPKSPNGDQAGRSGDPQPA